MTNMFSPFVSSGMECALATRQSHSQLGRWMFLANTLQELSLIGRLPCWLSPEIGRFVALRDLDISENWMPALPDEITKCVSLVNFYAYCNKFVSLPNEIGALAQLQRLDLTTNELTSLPDSICGLTALKELKCSGNHLQSLPDDFGKLTSLERLELHNNQLKALPDSMSGMCIEKITLHNNKLSSIPDANYGIDIKLYHNKFVEVPSALYKSITQTIDLRSNEIHSFASFASHARRPRSGPNGLLALSSITTMYLDYNNLELLPDEICGLTSLKVLNVTHNCLSSLPENIGSLPNLLTLDVSFNNIVTLPESLSTSSTYIIVNNNSIQHIPRCVVESRNTWDVSFNCIDPVCMMTPNVQKLNMESNNIQTLPTAITNMTGLLELKLSNNRISEVPPEIGECVRLRRLWLDGNTISELPSEMSGCVSLSALSLNRNPITSTPSSFLQLNSLVEITCDENQWELSQLALGNTISFQNVLDRNRHNRNSGVTSGSLLGKLKEWSSGTGLVWEDDDLAVFSESELQMVAEWVQRLANTRDFSNDAVETKHAATSIMHTVVNDPDFKKTFFAQIAANLERCGDRAAMAFNEIFTAWKLHTASDLDKRSRLDICIAVAKTNTLRELVSQVAGGRESVETYLWVEKELSDRLGLLTFARNCLYGVGKNSVNLEELQIGVNQNWETALFDMLEHQTKLFPDFPFQLPEDMQQQFHQRLDAIEERQCEGILTSGEYLEAMTEVQKAQMAKLKEVRREWMKSMMDEVSTT